VVLVAELEDGRVVEGESSITQARGRIRRVSLRPADVYPLPEVLEAIADADLVLIGPGSLYTSVIPNLLVKGVADALREASVPCVYVCNVMTQPGETDGFCAGDHIARVLDAVPGGVDVVVLHEGDFDPQAIAAYASMGQVPVEIDRARVEALGVRVVTAPLADAGRVVRHSPQALASVLLDLTSEQMARRASDPVAEPTA